MTRRNRELAYDLEKQVTASQVAKAELMEGLDQLHSLNLTAHAASAKSGLGS